MTKQYIYMNKEETRVVIDNTINHTVLSGDLSITDFPVNFKPKYVKNILWEKFCNLFSDLKIIPVDTSETFSSNYFEDKGYRYVWLLHAESGIVYRIWDNPTANNQSKLVDEKVIIKGIGVFPCEDFKVFNID